MRGQLAKALNLRNTPELTFVIDSSIEYGVHMSKLIDEVNKNLSDSNQLNSSESDDEEDSDDEGSKDDENESELDKSNKTDDDFTKEEDK